MPHRSPCGMGLGPPHTLVPHTPVPLLTCLGPVPVPVCSGMWPCPVPHSHTCIKDMRQQVGVATHKTADLVTPLMFFSDLNYLAIFEKDLATP